MFFLLYNGLAILVWPLYLLAGLFSSRVREFQKSRRIVEFPAVPEDRKCIWLHAASVGELDQALAIVRELRSRRSNAFIAVSVFSLSVKKLDQPGVDWMFRMPVDFPWAHAAILASLRPAVFVTMTWDVFPNLLRNLRRRKIPAYICSAALSPHSSRLKFPMKQLLRSVYASLAGIGAVDELNRQLFVRLHPDAMAVQVTGDSRYDSIFHRVESLSLNAEQERLLSHEGVTWILASTYRQCDAEILPHLPGLLSEFPDLRVLIFPHFVEEERLSQVERELALHGIEFGRFSRECKARVCIVDRMGILALAYRFALFCYVGGAFHHRVHNTGEPAAAHLAVLTGPRMEASPVARLLAEAGCLRVCASGEAVAREAREFLKDRNAARSLGDKAYIVISRERGGSQRFVNTFLRSVA
jgi:3-deoxy-D-manno-octulosonic-acid transferase